MRGEWKYDGLLVTDALWMKGVGGDSPGAAAVRALFAGNDVLLDPVDHRAAIDAIVAAVGSGTLTAAAGFLGAPRAARRKERLGPNEGASSTRRRSPRRSASAMPTRSRRSPRGSR